MLLRLCESASSAWAPKRKERENERERRRRLESTAALPLAPSTPVEATRARASASTAGSLCSSVYEYCTSTSSMSMVVGFETRRDEQEIGNTCTPEYSIRIGNQTPNRNRIGATQSRSIEFNRMGKVGRRH